MARKHRQILAKLDPIAVHRYNITEQDIQRIEKYLSIIQRRAKVGSTWKNVIEFNGLIATSIIIHELIELRWLDDLGLNPLKLSTKQLQQTLEANIEAHNAATYDEHIYLQELLDRLYQKHFEVATLIRANRGDNLDLELFLESEIGVYFLEADRIEEATAMLDRLKEEEMS